MQESKKKIEEINMFNADHMEQEDIEFYKDMNVDIKQFPSLTEEEKNIIADKALILTLEENLKTLIELPETVYRTIVISILQSSISILQTGLNEKEHLNK